VTLHKGNERVEPSVRQVGAQVSACVVQCLIERTAIGVEPVGEHVDRDAVDGESDKDAPLVRCQRGDSVLKGGEQLRLFGGFGGAEPALEKRSQLSCSTGISRPCQARLRSFTAASRSANL
jgi:hypothetical protein